jgi:hypothetical protein
VRKKDRDRDLSSRKQRSHLVLAIVDRHGVVISVQTYHGQKGIHKKAKPEEEEEAWKYTVD